MGNPVENILPPAEGKYAWTVKVGEKGQFVIPKEAREIFGINPGDTLVVLGDVKRGIAIPPKDLFSKIANDVFSSEKAKETEETED